MEDSGDGGDGPAAPAPAPAPMELGDLPGVKSLLEFYPHLSVEAAAFALSKHGGDVDTAAMYVLEGSFAEDLALARAARAHADCVYREGALGPADLQYIKRRTVSRYDEAPDDGDVVHDPTQAPRRGDGGGGGGSSYTQLRYRDGKAYVLRRGQKYLVTEVNPDTTDEGKRKMVSLEREFSLRPEHLALLEEQTQRFAGRFGGKVPEVVAAAGAGAVQAPLRKKDMDRAEGARGCN